MGPLTRFIRGRGGTNNRETKETHTETAAHRQRSGIRRKLESWKKSLRKHLLQRLFKARHRASSADLVQRLRDKIQAACHEQHPREDLSDGEDNYMTLVALRDAIFREDIHALFERYPWYRSDELEEIWSLHLQTIAVLITIYWNSWETFHEVFISHRNERSDHRLPLQKENLGFLEPQFQDPFYQKQHIFKPIVLKENEDMLLKKPERLPFIHEEHLEFGASGRVSQVTIDRYSYQYPDGSQNQRYIYLARKSFREECKDEFETERRALTYLRDKMIESGAQKALAIHRLSFSHRGSGNLIFDLAATDLHKLMNGTCDGFTNAAHRFTPYNVLDQLCDLLDALASLHEDRHKYMHLDLKPENILVYFCDRVTSPEEYAKYPAGRWVIGDLGLCREGSPDKNVDKKISNVIEGPPRERSSVYAPRGPGGFQAPEMVRDKRKVSRLTDMWSFGCMLCVSLAFILGRDEEVSRLYQKRSEGTTESNEYVNDYFWSGVYPDLSLKQGVTEWLEELPKEDWIQDLKHLILDLLKVQRDSRTTAREAKRRLESIRDKTYHLSQRW